MGMARPVSKGIITLYTIMYVPSTGTFKKEANKHYISRPLIGLTLSNMMTCCGVPRLSRRHVPFSPHIKEETAKKEEEEEDVIIVLGTCGYIATVLQ